MTAGIILLYPGCVPLLLVVTEKDINRDERHYASVHSSVTRTTPTVAEIRVII